MAEPLNKLAEKFKSCPKSEKCDHKRMELCALADLPPQNLASATQGILIDNMSPILREEIKSPLSPFRYKDELEKALNVGLLMPAIFAAFACEHLPCAYSVNASWNSLAFRVLTPFAIETSPYFLIIG
jgi:hypothetical protein